MKKYKLITVSQIFTQKGLVERANKQLNEYAEQGWEVVEMRKGWSVACPPKVVPSVKLVVVQTERNREYDT